MESFNGKLRDELLNQELFLSLAEARYVAERWRLDYNHHRPHSSLGWMTPAAFAVSCPSAVAGVFLGVRLRLTPGNTPGTAGKISFTLGYKMGEGYYGLDPGLNCIGMQHKSIRGLLGHLRQESALK